eukprot:4253772-Amphidinium_carterae.3
MATAPPPRKKKSPASTAPIKSNPLQIQLKACSNSGLDGTLHIVFHMNLSVELPVFDCVRQQVKLDNIWAFPVTASWQQSCYNAPYDLPVNSRCLRCIGNGHAQESKQMIRSTYFRTCEKTCCSSYLFSQAA